MMQGLLDGHAFFRVWMKQTLDKPVEIGNPRAATKGRLCCFITGWMNGQRLASFSDEVQLPTYGNEIAALDNRAAIKQFEYQATEHPGLHGGEITGFWRSCCRFTDYLAHKRALICVLQTIRQQVPVPLARLSKAFAQSGFIALALALQQLHHRVWLQQARSAMELRRKVRGMLARQQFQRQAVDQFRCCKIQVIRTLGQAAIAYSRHAILADAQIIDIEM